MTGFYMKRNTGLKWLRKYTGVNINLSFKIKNVNPA